MLKLYVKVSEVKNAQETPKQPKEKVKSNPLQIAEPGTQKRYSCSGNFEKFPRKKSVKLYFFKKLANKRLHKRWFPGIFPKYFGSAI